MGVTGKDTHTSFYPKTDAFNMRDFKALPFIFIYFLFFALRKFNTVNRLYLNMRGDILEVNMFGFVLLVGFWI